MIFNTLQNVNPGKPAMQAMGGLGMGGMSAISGMFNRPQRQGQGQPQWGSMHQQQMPGNTGIVPPHMAGGGMEGMVRPMAPGGFAMNNFQLPQQMQPFQNGQNPMRWG